MPQSKSLKKKASAIFIQVSAEGSAQWATEQDLRSLQRVWEAKLFHLSPSYRVLAWQQSATQSGHDTTAAQPPSAATASGSSPPATQRSSDAMLIVSGEKLGSV